MTWAQWVELCHTNLDTNTHAVDIMPYLYARTSIGIFAIGLN